MRYIFRAAASPIVRATGALLFGSLMLASVDAVQWQIGVIDAGIGGEYSSLRIDTHGNGHVAYLDANGAFLKYAFWDHTLDKWFTTVLDRSLGFCSLALDSEQRPHISYLDYGTYKLKYAHWTGTTWEKQTLQISAKQIQFYTSIAIGTDNNPSITYYEYLDPDGVQEIHLRNVFWNGVQWGLRTIDPTPGSGKFNSIAVDSAGNFHVAYGDVAYENASLRYASWNGHSWNVEILEGAGRPGTSMWSTALFIDKADHPHIAYTDVINRLVKYATKVNGTWTTEVVDSLKKEGYPDRNGIALDEAGNPYISYYDAGTGLLKLAHQVGHQWVTEVVDRDYAGYTSSLQIYQGTIWITYADGLQKSLKFARRSVDASAPALKEGSETILKAPPRR